MFTPNIGSAQGDGYTGRPTDGPVPSAYRPDFMDAPYLPYEIQNEILGLWGTSVAPLTYRQLLTCGSGDAIGAAVRISADNTVATATADTQPNSNAIGFIRSKPTPTSCYIAHYDYATGLAGGTAGDSIFLADDGSFSATPGTFVKVIGTFDSPTTGYVNVSPAIPANVTYDYFKSVVSSPTTISNSTVWQNGTVLTLDPTKTYDICAMAAFDIAGSAPDQIGLAISLYSNNDTTDHVLGDNVLLGPPPGVFYNSSLSIPNFRITGVSSVYWKILCDYGGTAPTFVGSARVTEVRI